jgi:phosphohistidine phosphatase SixA
MAWPPHIPLPRRGLALGLALLLPARRALATEAAAWEALRQGGIVLFRHAHAPGGGDPAGMRLGECATQRNLDGQGRAQAIRIGEAMRARGITVGAVLTSQWCRTTETAELAFPGLGRPEPIFNSFFADRSAGPAQTEAARRLLLGWAGPGALFVSTHQVNIMALTQIVSASGEGVVLQARGGELRVVGRIQP